MQFNQLYPSHIGMGLRPDDCRNMISFMNHMDFNMRHNNILISLVLLAAGSATGAAQETKEMRDTIRQAVIVSDRFTVRDAGTRIVSVPGLSTIVSATGNADIIKFVQLLPGVSTGAEGSSAIYVRGGNLGNNVTTLDGTPIYGGSHLLGLTSAYPAEIVSKAVFRVGGFHGDESNVTSSHIGLESADGSFTDRAFSASASTFLLGGTASMPLIKDRLSLIASVRISPLGPEFNAVKALVGRSLDSLDRVRAVAFDAFVKAKWRMNPRHSLALSIFSSLDGYSYRYGSNNTEQNMGWGNFIVNARHEGVMKNGWSVEDGLSFNRFNGHQGIVQDMGGIVNNLAVVSTLNELKAEATFSRMVGRHGNIRLGLRERFSRFNPGTSATYKGEGALRPLDSPISNHVSHSSITTAHFQWDYSRRRFELMTSARLNAFAGEDREFSKWNWRFNPEAGILAKLNLAEWLSVEATADWTVQYYHTLEGIPLGWSVDLIVPTGRNRPPERASQYYAGIFSSFGNHHLSLGAYTKKMDGLVYFQDASQLFSSAIAGWSNNVKVGTGSSKGMEFLYEKVGGRMNYKLAYTLSKTDRLFEEVNKGHVFPAKFDRRHILNASANCVIADNEKFSLALNGLFTWQSGHWETVAAGEYPSLPIFGDDYTFDYFTSVNNYKMPDYIRLDLGCGFRFKTRLPQELNIGVYNVLNRHNPFSIIYDDRTREWFQVSLLPIMPSFNYRISF